VTGQVRDRYRTLRVLGLPARFALEFARESVTRYPSSPAFARRLVQLEQQLRAHYGNRKKGRK
jgi:hypothetical protein